MQLAAINNPLIQIFKDNELRLIKENTAYHFPEDLETDEKNLNDRRRVITKDLKWRSFTVSSFNIHKIYLLIHN